MSRGTKVINIFYIREGVCRVLNFVNYSYTNVSINSVERTYRITHQVQLVRHIDMYESYGISD